MMTRIMPVPSLESKTATTANMEILRQFAIILLIAVNEFKDTQELRIA